MEKFKFYYEPGGTFDIKSFTLSIEEEEIGYKIKVVKEVFDGTEIKKIKIRNIYENIDDIIQKIENIDFKKERKKEGNHTLIVKYGSNKIETNSLEEVNEIVKDFKIDELLDIYIENIIDIKEFLMK